MYLESSATAAALWSRSADFLSKDPGTLFEEVMLGGLGGMVTPGSNLGNFAMADTTSRSSLLLLLLLLDDDCLGLFSTEDEDEEDASLSLLKKALQTE